jgi:phospholipid transport system transporter-binding protein
MAKSVMASAAAEVELQERAPGKFAASGLLTFATARRAREFGLAAFGVANSRELEVDFSGVTSWDSAGMTVLLDWLAIAKRNGRSMHFASLSKQVQAIARISDVLELLEKGV